MNPNMNKNKNKNMIVKGDKGIMDLDLSLVPENVRKIAIEIGRASCRERV